MSLFYIRLSTTSDCLPSLIFKEMSHLRTVRLPLHWFRLLPPSLLLVTETAIIFANYATKSYRTSTCIVMVAKAYSIRITTSASVAMETTVTKSLLRCILPRKRRIAPSTTRVTMGGTLKETSALAGKARPARAAASARAARAGVTSVSRCTCASLLWMKCLL